MSDRFKKGLREKRATFFSRLSEKSADYESHSEGRDFKQEADAGSKEGLADGGNSGREKNRKKS